MPCPTAIALKGITLLLSALFGGRLSIFSFGSGLTASVRTVHSQFVKKAPANTSLAELAPLFDALGGAEHVGVDVSPQGFDNWH